MKGCVGGVELSSFVTRNRKPEFLVAPILRGLCPKQHTQQDDPYNASTYTGTSIAFLATTKRRTAAEVWEGGFWLQSSQAQRGDGGDTPGALTQPLCCPSHLPRSCLPKSSWPLRALSKQHGCSLQACGATLRYIIDASLPLRAVVGLLGK